MNHYMITPHHAPDYSARRASTGRCHRKCCWTPYGHRLDATDCTCHVPDDPPAPATPEEIAERVLGRVGTPEEPRRVEGAETRRVKCEETRALARGLYARYGSWSAVTEVTGIGETTLCAYGAGSRGASGGRLEALRRAAA